MNTKNVFLALAVFFFLGFSAHAQSKKGSGKQGTEVESQMKQSTEPQKGEVKLEVPTAQPAPQFAEPEYPPKQEITPSPTPSEMEKGKPAPAQMNRLEPKAEKGSTPTSKASKGKK